MFARGKIENLNSYFQDLETRNGHCVYFGRLNGYNNEVDAFLQKYYECARKAGVIIEGKLQNPDEKNLSYYREMMGDSFQVNASFIDAQLRKWLPRMNQVQRSNVSESIYNTLLHLRSVGKNDNMLKNAYIKFMCWLYYKMERIANHLGESQLPKILYEGTVSNYELLFFSALSNAGCDILLVQKNGDDSYSKQDRDNYYSDNIILAESEPFMSDFSLKKIQLAIQDAQNQKMLYRALPSLQNCTNAWMTGNILEDLVTGTGRRGTDNRFFYNCFCRVNGANDRLTYLDELYRLQNEVKSYQRNLIIIDQKIPVATNEEIREIKRGNYTSRDQMIMSLSCNIVFAGSNELQKLMNKAFVDVMLIESARSGNNLNRLTSKAVNLLCWLKRFQGRLFKGWKPADIEGFYHFGGCKSENEALFLSLLGRLPVDVVVFKPDLNQTCCLSDELLYDINYSESVAADHFPQEKSGVKLRTAAYYAERDLDKIMYQDTGIYRSQQYAQATAVTLETMYEEIKILWDQELKFRSGFQTMGDQVSLPVIFAKVSGIKNGDVNQYWKDIKCLLNDDTQLITRTPYIDPLAPNPIKAYTTQFIKNGKLQRNKIVSHRNYQYGFVRQEMQEHILDKIQFMIDEKVIAGTFQNGTEYTVLAVGLNIPKEMLRVLQKFDFTQKNPKIVYVLTGEKRLSLEDTILMELYHLIGFDIVFFVPTGYQSIEHFFNKHTIAEHVIGEFMYDLQVPDFDSVTVETASIPIIGRFLKRGK